MPSLFIDAVPWLRRRAWQIALVLASAALAGLFGLGLLTTVLPLLGGDAGLAGALVGAVVVVAVLPLALWARVPPLPRALWRHAGAAGAPGAAASPAAAPSATVTPLHPPRGASAGPVGLAAGFGVGRRGGLAMGTGAGTGTGAGAAVAASGGLGAEPVADARRASLAPAGPDLDLAAAALGTDPGSPVRDALTGAYSQQHFVAAADREWSRIRRHGEDAALLMIDIDRLKGVNERYGAGCGDSLLVEITRQVSGTLRQYDLLARFGGGVLVVYLPHTDPIGALDVAERIRERVAALRVTWETHSVRSTVSVGVAAIGASHGALDEVIADAGAALREAKAAGRNCVRAGPIPPRRSVTPGFPLGARRPAGPL